MRGLLVAALLAQAPLSTGTPPECQPGWSSADGDRHFSCVDGKWVYDEELTEHLRRVANDRRERVLDLGRRVMTPDEIGELSWDMLVPPNKPFYEEDMQKQFHALMATQVRLQQIAAIREGPRDGARCEGRGFGTAQAREIPCPKLDIELLSPPACDKARADAIEKVRSAWAPRFSSSAPSWNPNLWGNPCSRECLMVTTTPLLPAIGDSTSAACYRCLADAKDARDKAEKEQAERERVAREALDAVDAACGEPKP